MVFVIFSFDEGHHDMSIRIETEQLKILEVNTIAKMNFIFASG